LQEVAEAAGFNKGALYTHIRSKEELFLAPRLNSWSIRLVALYVSSRTNRQFTHVTEL